MKLKNLVGAVIGIALLTNQAYSWDYSRIGVLSKEFYAQNLSMFIKRNFKYCEEGYGQQENIQELIENNEIEFLRFNELVDFWDKKGFISFYELTEFYKSHCSRAPKSN